MKFPNFNMNKSFAARALVLLAGLLLIAASVTAQKIDAPTASNPAANLDQCRNGGLPDPPQPCAGGNWVNGNVGQQNAQWKENDFLPYRMLFSNLVTGANGDSSTHVYTLVLGYDIKHSGAHAIDYLGSYNYTDANAVPCDVGSFCSNVPSTLPIPPDTAFVTNQPNPNAAGTCTGPSVGTACISQIPGVLTMWGGTLQSFSYTAADGLITDSQVERQVTITFTAQVSNPVLSWGGHVGFVGDWGAGNSAGGISGSPYHMRLKSLDGVGGNQDRSLSALAVAVTGAVRIQKQVFTNDCTDASSAVFNFGDTSGNIGGSFTLQDLNGQAANSNPCHPFGPGAPVQRAVTQFGPSNAITVSELQTANGSPGAPAGYSLAGVNCTETAAQDSTKNQLQSFATIIVQPGEVVTCTFSNTALLPTAAPASVNGRVTNAFGNGISGATVGLTDLSSGQTRYALTNSFGYYTFDNCQTEDFYLLTVEAKRYKFSNNQMTFTLQDNLFNMDFTSNQ